MTVKWSQLSPAARARLGGPERRAAKYRACPTIYNGRRYASRAEAHYAEGLDLRVRLGELLCWIPQPLFLLVTGFAYRPDFLVVGIDAPDHRLGAEAVDVKGVETQRFRDAKRLWAAHAAIPLRVVCSGSTELIVPDRGRARQGG